MIKLEKPNQLFRDRARELRKNSTLSEVLLWMELRNKKFMGLDFDRQKVINNKYIADLYCAQHNLIIEIDGDSHDNKYDYDRARDEYLMGLGFSVMHIDDLDIKKNIGEVLSRLAFVITTTPSAPRLYGK